MSLVSKRFHSLCHGLMRRLAVCIADNPDSRLRSLRRWLAAARGRHLSTFRLDTRQAERRGLYVDPQLLVTCLAACCTSASRLDTLEVSAPSMPTMSWLLPCRSTLRRLDLAVGDRLALDVNLRAVFSRLRELELCGKMTFGRGAELPPTLTRLHLVGGGDSKLPRQASACELSIILNFMPNLTAQPL